MKTKPAVEVLKVSFPTSSNIDSLEYCKSGMVATFKNGDRYIYRGVPKEVFTVLCEASSVGSAFHRLIRGRFEFEKIPNLDTYISTEQL